MGPATWLSRFTNKVVVCNTVVGWVSPQPTSRGPTSYIHCQRSALPRHLGLPLPPSQAALMDKASRVMSQCPTNLTVVDNQEPRRPKNCNHLSPTITDMNGFVAAGYHEGSMHIVNPHSWLDNLLLGTVGNHLSLLARLTVISRHRQTNLSGLCKRGCGWLTISGNKQQEKGAIPTVCMTVAD